jgi:uncharacterized membrane protein YhiD involved in acid resistance
VLRIGMIILGAMIAAFAVAAQPDAALPHVGDPVPDLIGQLPGLLDAVLRLPLAALLGAVLAFRPRRSGTPARKAAVIQTQILLAIVGSVVMLIVGQSLARAFGIAGVAGLVRYRAKVSDPKDAGVMLANLGVGLACGVGLYLVAGFATAFLLGFLWWVESFEPNPLRHFHLDVRAPAAEELRGRLETLLERYRAKFDLRSLSGEEISYEVRLLYDIATEDISIAIMLLGEPGKIAVAWEEKKGS